MMTREDMLRELELLPVWRLRAPLQQTPPQQVQDEPVQESSQSLAPELVPQVEVSAPQSMDVQSEDDLHLEATEAELAEMPTMPELALDNLPLFRHIASEDGDWLFVFSHTEPTADESQLLHNIFRAMGVKAKTAQPPALTRDLLQSTQPKIIVAMGEPVAQVLLQSELALASLRGTVHAVDGTALVATYDPAHLLQTMTDKAKTWQDLCLAMQQIKASH